MKALSTLMFALCAGGTIGQTSFQVGSTTVNVVEMATDLNVPWDMVIGPDGWIWFTEIDGRVSRMDPDNGTVELIHTVADVYGTGLGGGLQSMAFHPDFADQPYVYFHYCTASNATVVKRFTYDAGSHSFTAVSPHLLNVPLQGGASHNGSRLVVDDEGMFLLCLGDVMSGSANVQDLSTTYGKILRFDPDGGIPADNPIPGSYVYNWGHRNPQGLLKASNGVWYNSAHGAGYDDEVNVVEPDRNYGWPTVAGYCTTPTEIAYCDANDVKEPIHEWSTEIVAPSGIDYFDNTAIPGWQNSILVATLRGKALHQLQLAPDGQSVVGSAAFLMDTRGRFRDVLVYPDGRVFLSTSNHDWAGSPLAGDDKILALVSENITTGIATATNSGIGLWPDPAREVLFVDLPGQGGTASIVDASGRICHRVGLRSGRNEIALGALARGPYVLRVDDGQALRFVKE